MVLDPEFGLCDRIAPSAKLDASVSTIAGTSGSKWRSSVLYVGESCSYLGASSETRQGMTGCSDCPWYRSASNPEGRAGALTFERVF